MFGNMLAQLALVANKLELARLTQNTLHQADLPPPYTDIDVHKETHNPEEELAQARPLPPAHDMATQTVS